MWFMMRFVFFFFWEQREKEERSVSRRRTNSRQGKYSKEKRDIEGLLKEKGMICFIKE